MLILYPANYPGKLYYVNIMLRLSLLKRNEDQICKFQVSSYTINITWHLFRVDLHVTGVEEHKFGLNNGSQEAGNDSAGSNGHFHGPRTVSNDNNWWFKRKAATVIGFSELINTSVYNSNSIYFNGVNGKVIWQNPKMKSLN